MGRRKAQITNIFSDDAKTHNEYTDVQEKLYKTKEVQIVESSEVDDPKESYVKLSAQFRQKIRMGGFVNDEPDAIMQARYLMKMGWRAGMQTNDLIEYVQEKLPDDKKRFVTKVMKEARDMVYIEVSQLNAGEVFSRYVERCRHIISKWEEQASFIARYWKSGGDETQLHREYSVIWKLIYDAEKEMLKIGKDLGIFSTKEQDNGISVEFTHSLLPDPEMAKMFIPRSMKEIKKEQMDTVEIAKPFEIEFDNGKV
jgi:hypothetical protein